jgi:Phage tail lysozyme
VIAAAFVVLGAIAAWQFSAYDTAPATAGSVLRAQDTARYLGPPVSGQVRPFMARALSWSAERPGDAAALDSTASGRPAAGATSSASAAAPGAASTHRAAPSAASRPAPAPAKPAGPACTGTGGMLPENYGAIVGFLVAHGYTAMAAAGIAGNIYQESGGNPESVGTGGGGLIGWTPLPAGFVTGNPAPDLQTQLTALLAFNQQWAAFIPALNAATNPTQAADIYMDDFERPGLPAAYNREAAANAVARACGIAG